MNANIKQGETAKSRVGWRFYSMKFGFQPTTREWSAFKERQRDETSWVPQRIQHKAHLLPPICRPCAKKKMIIDQRPMAGVCIQGIHNDVCQFTSQKSQEPETHCRSFPAYEFVLPTPTCTSAQCNGEGGGGHHRLVSRRGAQQGWFQVSPR